VEKRLNSDLPVGITLSGGLDSTSVACILSELLMKKNKPLYAFSSVLPVDYKGIEKDERQYIEIVGKHCPNIIQTYVEAPGTGPLSNLEEAFGLEEAFPNSFFYMDRALAEAAAEKNIRNFFSGFGGDFWISNKGSSVIYLLIKQGEYRSAFRLIRQLSENGSTSLLHEFRTRYLSHTGAYKSLRSVIKRNGKEIDWQKKTFLRDDFLDQYAVSFYETQNEQTVSAQMKQIVETGRISRILFMLYTRNGYFRMDSPIPLFDKSLMEFLFDVPERLLIENGMPRNLLRSSVKQLIPRQIYNRVDKLPYSPGFPGRVLNERHLFEKILAGSDISVHRQFIMSEKAMEHFDEVKPFTGFGQSNKIIHNRIAHAGIAA
jgi:asparagine synthase (glutamine-hydrolysing)